MQHFPSKKFKKKKKASARTRMETKDMLEDK